MFCRGAATMEPHSRTRLMIDQVTEPSPVAPPPPAARIFPFAKQQTHGDGCCSRTTFHTHTNSFSLKSFSMFFFFGRLWGGRTFINHWRWQQMAFITRGNLPTFGWTIEPSSLGCCSWSCVGGPARWCPVPIGRRERAASRRPASSRRPAGSCRRSETTWARPATLRSTWIAACLALLDTAVRYA